jgi:3',5'-cyclic AMP phosphodiesterase CpdA
MRQTTRRTALKGLSAGMLLALGRWPGAVRAQGSGMPRGDFRFVVVNDTHYMSDECVPWLERAISLMAKERPAFILHLGDLVERGHRDHLQIVKDLFAAVPMPWYSVIGNHDHLMPADRTNYEELFPERINYAFEHQGWRFIGLDTCEGGASRSTISDATFQWLEAHLARVDRKQPLVVFTHFPLAAGVRYRPSNADCLLDLFLPYNLQTVFCGHLHAATENAFDNAPIVTNRCCALKRKNHDGSEEKGFFSCTVEAGRLSRRFVRVDV